MATVYLAADRKHHREVALKVLLPGLAAFLGVERFLKEIEIAARLTHPHVMALHDSGEAAGFLYYVMPYIEGGSLRLLRPSHGRAAPRHQTREYPLLAGPSHRGRLRHRQGDRHGGRRPTHPPPHPPGHPPPQEAPAARAPPP